MVMLASLLYISAGKKDPEIYESKKAVYICFPHAATAAVSKKDLLSRSLVIFAHSYYNFSFNIFPPSYFTLVKKKKKEATNNKCFMFGTRGLLNIST